MGYSTTCLDFDGSNDYVSVGNVAVLDVERSDAVSWSYWFKSVGKGPGGMTVFGKQSNTTPEGWSIPHDGLNGRISVFFVHTWATNLIQVITDNGWNDGRWHLCVITKAAAADAGSFTFYVDGLPVGASTVYNSLVSNIANANVATIGRRIHPSSPEYYKGRLDELALWDKELSAGEVTSLWNLGLPGDLSLLGFYANCVWWLRMGEGATYPTIPDEIASADGIMTSMAADDIVADAPGEDDKPGGLVVGPTVVEELYGGTWNRPRPVKLVALGAGGDTTPPTIDDFDPPVGTPIARSDFISFTVTDTSPGLRIALVLVEHKGQALVIHDGFQFKGEFTNYSSRTEIVAGESYRYRVKPNGGWITAPVFSVAAVDAAGNLTPG